MSKQQINIKFELYIILRDRSMKTNKYFKRQNLIPKLAHCLELYP